MIFLKKLLEFWEDDLRQTLCGTCMNYIFAYLLVNSGLSHNYPKYLYIIVAYSIAREVLAYGGETQDAMVEEDGEGWARGGAGRKDMLGASRFREKS